MVANRPYYSLFLEGFDDATPKLRNEALSVILDRVLIEGEGEKALIGGPVVLPTEVGSQVVSDYDQSVRGVVNALETQAERDARLTRLPSTPKNEAELKQRLVGEFLGAWKGTGETSERTRKLVASLRTQEILVIHHHSSADWLRIVTREARRRREESPKLKNVRDLSDDEVQKIADLTYRFENDFGALSDRITDAYKVAAANAGRP